MELTFEPQGTVYTPKQFLPKLLLILTGNRDMENWRENFLCSFVGHAQKNKQPWICGAVSISKCKCFWGYWSYSDWLYCAINRCQSRPRLTGCLISWDNILNWLTWQKKNLWNLGRLMFSSDLKTSFAHNMQFPFWELLLFSLWCLIKHPFNKLMLQHDLKNHPASCCWS